MKFNLYHKALKVNKIEFIFYSVGTVMLLFGLMNMYNVHQYIQGLMNKGQVDISQQFSQVMTSYVEAFLPYMFYSCTLFGIGYVISCMKKNNFSTVINKEETIEEEEDIDLYLRTIH